MSESERGQTVPKSMRQKRILDVAAERPDATMEDLASNVPGATTECVERVLEEYGDPAADPDESTSAVETGSADPDDLTEVQFETLVAICEHPDASQRELANVLGVSAATVSNRVNAIAGFDWEDRQRFARDTVERASDSDRRAGATGRRTDGSESSPQDEPECERASDGLSERLAAVERRLEDIEGSEGTDTALDCPALVHKVVHACVASDAITEEEELEILRALLE